MTNPAAPLAEQLKTLESVQELDLKIDKLNRERSDIPTALKSAQDAVAKAQSAVNLKLTEIANLEKGKKQNQAALDLNADRLQRSTQQMEAVKNTSEYNARTKEIDQLHKMNGELTKEIGKLETSIQSVKDSMQTQESALAQAQTDLTSKTSELGGHGDALLQDLSKLQKERTELVVGVERRVLSTYDRVRGARAGLGLSPAIAGRCKACNIVLPPQMFNELQKGKEMHQCPTCYRILFFKN